MCFSAQQQGTRWCSTSRSHSRCRAACPAARRPNAHFCGEVASPSRRHTEMAADTTPGAGALQPCPPLEKSEEAPHRTQLHESRRRRCHHMPGARASPCAAAPPTPDFSSRGPRAARSGAAPPEPVRGSSRALAAGVTPRPGTATSAPRRRGAAPVRAA